MTIYNYTYIAALLFCLGCMVLVDYRFKLGFFDKPKQTAVVLVVGLTLFMAWDIAGISLGIFLSGTSPYMSGWFLGPHFPVEEIFFLLFLCYFTLIIYRIGEQRCRHTRS